MRQQKISKFFEYQIQLTLINLGLLRLNFLNKIHSILNVIKLITFVIIQLINKKLISFD